MEGITNLLKEFPAHFVNFIIASGLLASYIKNFYYKTNVKLKYQKIYKTNDILKLFQLYLRFKVIFPIVFMFLLHIMFTSKGIDDKFIYFLMTLMLILDIVLICIYLIKTIKKHPLNIAKTKLDKIKVLFNYYIIQITTLIFSIPSNLLMIMVITDISTTSENIFIQSHDDIFSNVLMYIFSIFLLYEIIRDFLEKIDDVKYIMIYYMQNNEIKEDTKIKFDDFDIDKNYFSYLDTNGIRKVVPTKNLLRIEYVYKK